MNKTSAAPSRVVADSIALTLLTMFASACSATISGTEHRSDNPDGGPPGENPMDPPSTNPEGRVFMGAGDVPVVFVSRPNLQRGSIYWDGLKGVPGMGAATRARASTPGKLLVLETNGQLRTLVDGANPNAQSLQLVDVNAPDVDYDAQRIVFAGLVSGQFDVQSPTSVVGNANGWRLFVINTDGSGLRQVTQSDQNVDCAQFEQGGCNDYDDMDPVWLPDGRIAFSSTRWFIFGNYSGVRASNLYVVDDNGANMRRITSERNGADRLAVDPITGKIVYSRWWRNHRFPIDDMSTIPDDEGYVQKDGLTANRSVHETMFRNAWHLAAIRPDGTGLVMWNSLFRSDDRTHVYGGSFIEGGDFYGNYLPLGNMTEVTGCGGVRHYRRGPNGYDGVIGQTENTLDYAHVNPTSYGCNKGQYAMDATPLPNGKIVVSIADTTEQDYGLHVMEADGTNAQLLYDNPGTVEARAKAIAVRVRPPVLPDTTTNVASLLPPTSDPSTFRKDGTFEFIALNVYANGPVDADMVHAVPVGSAKSIRFFIDHQRVSTGSFPSLDWPNLLGEAQIDPSGAVADRMAPANVPLFEQLRDPNNRVPLAGGRDGDDSDGFAHVAGFNFGRPGQKARCVGCHTGHTMIPVPENDADAAFSNLAPGAMVQVSSSRAGGNGRGLTDRRVMKGSLEDYWQSGSNGSGIVTLVFPVPVSVRTVVLYNPRGQSGQSTMQIGSATVELFSDAAAQNSIATADAQNLSVMGTPVAFQDVRARAVRVTVGSVQGTLLGSAAPSLAEIEVIARGEAP